MGIRELSEEIKGYQQNALQIKKESDALIAKNQELETELQTKLVSLYKKLKIKNKNVSDDHIDLAMDESDFNEYQQRVNILSQQNKLLRETEVRSKHEREKYLQIINENKKNINLLQSELEKVNSINNEFEEISKNLNYENNELKQLNDEMKNNVVIKLNEKLNFLQDQLQKETNANNDLNKRCNEYENEYNSLNNLHTKVDKQLNATQTENSELLHKIDALQEDVNEYVNLCATNKIKMASMSESLESVESILEQYKNKEMDYLKQLNDIKNANELFLNLEKDKLLLENKMCLDKINSLQNEKKQQMTTAHKEQQDLIASMNATYNEKERSLNESINDLLAKNAKLSEERTQIETKYRVIKEDVDALKKMYANKFEHTMQTANDLNVKIKELDLESTRCSDLAKRKESDLTNHEKLWQKERSIFNQTIAELNKNDDKKNLILIQNEEKILTQNEKLEKLNESLKMEKTMSAKQIHELDDTLNKNESSYTLTIGNYKKELTNLETLYSESQVQTKDIVNRHEALSRKWKEENRKTFDNFTQIVNELKSENKTVIHSNIKLSSELDDVINNELKQTLSSNQEIKRKLANYQKSMHSLDESANSLKKMNEKYQKKESLLLNENKSLREQLNQATISMQRMQRKQHFNQKINCH